MHLDPNAAPPLAQLQSPPPPGIPQVPVMAACSPRQRAFAADDQAASAAFLQDLLPGELESQIQHDPPILTRQDKLP